MPTQKRNTSNNASNNTTTQPRTPQNNPLPITTNSVVLPLDQMTQGLVQNLQLDTITKQIENLFVQSTPNELANQVKQDVSASVGQIPPELQTAFNQAFDRSPHPKALGAKAVIEAFFSKEQLDSPQVKKALLATYELIGTTFGDEVANQIAKTLVKEDKYKEIQTAVSQTIKQSVLQVFATSIPFLGGTEVTEIVLNNIDRRNNIAGKYGLFVLLVIALLSTVCVFAITFAQLGRAVLDGFRRNARKIFWLFIKAIIYTCLLVYILVFTYNRAFVEGGETTLGYLDEKEKLAPGFDWKEEEFGFSTKDPRETSVFYSNIVYLFACVLNIFSFIFKEVPERVRKFREAETKKQKILQVLAVSFSAVEKMFVTGISSYHVYEGVKDGLKLSRIFSKPMQAAIGTALGFSLGSAITEAVDHVDGNLQKHEKKLDEIFADFLKQENLNADVDTLFNAQKLSKELLTEVKAMRQAASNDKPKEKVLMMIMENILGHIDQAVEATPLQTRF
jgi:hypothetical protein